MRQSGASLGAATGGSVTTEFALLAPVMFALLLGVLHIGVGMQNYNALRGITADMARYVAVEYQTSNQLTNAQIQALGTAIAVQSPYMLDNEHVLVTVADADPQRVVGAKELTFTIRYTVPSLLEFIDIPSFPISYSRSLFLLVDEDTTETPSETGSTASPTA